MASMHGKFVWYDVMTADTQAARKFYSAVAGWTAQDSGMPGMDYIVFSKGDKMVGGLMPIPPDAKAMGVPPTWMGYIAVDDVDEFAKKVVAAGGSIRKQPENIPGVGRFAAASDPHGAGFLLFKGEGTPQPPPPQGTPSHFGWNELHAGDLDTEWAFYAKLFGWTRDQAMDMGEMGIYQTFKAGGDQAVGGMMTRTRDTPHPHWLYYINVDAIDAGAKKVTDNGGKILMGPLEVPGGMWIVSCTDPQGAMFALLGPKR